MSSTRFNSVYGMAAIAALLLECSGGLPQDTEGGAGAPSEAAGSGGTLAAAGGAHGAGRSSTSPSGAAGQLPSAAGGAAGEAEAGAAGTAGAPAVSGDAGSAGSCGARRCDSSLDNDCSGAPDNLDAVCACSEPNAQRTCNTGKFGVCAVGTQTCKFASDATESAWSACEGPVAGLRDCRYATDNNCDGTPDNAEGACTVCSVGAARACNPHSEDGHGSCKAGNQTCVLSAGNASVGYGPCSGDVAPIMEACGPFQADATTPTADSNCNDLNGDGDYTKPSQTCVVTTTTKIAGEFRNLFKDSHSGTSALHSCQVPSVGGCPQPSYVTFGSCGSPNQTDTVIGYAPTTALAKYTPVTVPAFSWTCTVYPSQNLTIQVPAFTFYVLP